LLAGALTSAADRAIFRRTSGAGHCEALRFDRRDDT
jgi:hypothetical protein